MSSLVRTEYTISDIKKTDLDDPKAVKAFVEDFAARVGYHPIGYGCYDPEVKRLMEGGYKVSWLRGSTCD